MSLLEDVSLALQAGRAPKVKELVQQAVDEGIPAKDVLEQGLLSGMSVVGEKFKNNEVFVPEVLIAARAMNAGVAALSRGIEPVHGGISVYVDVDATHQIMLAGEYGDMFLGDIHPFL